METIPRKINSHIPGQAITAKSVNRILIKCLPPVLVEQMCTDFQSILALFSTLHQKVYIESLSR